MTTAPDPWPAVAARLEAASNLQYDEDPDLPEGYCQVGTADLRTALSLIAEMRADHAENFAGKVVMTPEAFEPLTQRAEAAELDAARYRHLRDHCSCHYPMTHEQPAEWSIGWEFQQSTPAQAFGSFDSLIDADIAQRAADEAGDEMP